MVVAVVGTGGKNKRTRRQQSQPTHEDRRTTSERRIQGTGRGAGASGVLPVIFVV